MEADEQLYCAFRRRMLHIACFVVELPRLVCCRLSQCTSIRSVALSLTAAAVKLHRVDRAVAPQHHPGTGSCTPTGWMAQMIRALMITTWPS